MQFRAYIACIKYHSSGSRARVGGAPALRCAPVGAVRRRLQFTCVAVPWSRPAAARCPDRPALGAAPTATLRAGSACGWRGLYAPTAPPNTPFGAIAARLSALRAAKLSFGAIRCWGVAPSRRGYRRSFCPLRGGAAHLRAYARRAMRGGIPPRPPSE